MFLNDNIIKEEGIIPMVQLLVIREKVIGTMTSSGDMLELNLLDDDICGSSSLISVASHHVYFYLTGDLDI